MPARLIPRAALALTLALPILACMGEPEDTDEDVVVEEPAPAKRGKRRFPKGPGAPDGGATDGASPDAGDGGDGGEGGGGGGSTSGGSTSGGTTGSTSGGAPAPAPSNPPAGVTQISDTKWEVQRSVIDGWVSDPGGLGNATQKKGGVKLSGISTSTDSYHMGFRNEDVVKSINGYTLTSQGEALLAYAMLKNEDKLSVVIKRDGATRTHTYIVLD